MVGRWLLAGILAAGGLIAWSASGAAADSAGSDGVLTDPGTAEYLAGRVIELTNEERAAESLPPLRWETHLHDAAMWMAQDMADGDYLSHTDSLDRSPQLRLADFAYSGGITGENVARGFPSPESVVTAWMGSEHHRANILRATFREMGAGYAETDANPSRWYWVQDFGTRAGVYPVVVNGEAMTTTLSTVALYIYGEGWADSMRLSNDGATWTDWGPYAPERSWSLEPGPGKRDVYVEIRRSADVRQATDSIVVDDGSGVPTATVTTPTPTATTTATATEPEPTNTATATAPTATTTATATQPEPTNTATATTPATTPTPTVTEPPPTDTATATTSATTATPTPTVTQPPPTDTATPSASPTQPPPTFTRPPTSAPSPTSGRGSTPFRLFVPMALTAGR
jgi:uncharacterized protein YkwD